MWQLTIYCHLRPPDATPFLTLNVLGPRDTSDLISMLSFTFITRRHLTRLALAPFISSRFAKFGWFPFAVCNAWQRSRTQNLRRVGKISSPILCRLSTKVHDVVDLLYFPTPLTVYLCHVSLVVMMMTKLPILTCAEKQAAY